MKCMLSTLMGKMRYTIQDVHEKTGLGRSTITELYHDRASRIDYATIEKLCSLFECSVGELFVLDADADKKPSEKSKEILSNELKKALSEHDVSLTDEELASVSGGAVIIVKPRKSF